MLTAKEDLLRKDGMINHPMAIETTGKKATIRRELTNHPVQDQVIISRQKVLTATNPNTATRLQQAKPTENPVLIRDQRVLMTRDRVGKHLVGNHRMATGLLPKKPIPKLNHTNPKDQEPPIRVPMLAVTAKSQPMATSRRHARLMEKQPVAKQHGQHQQITVLKKEVTATSRPKEATAPKTGKKATGRQQAEAAKHTLHATNDQADPHLKNVVRVREKAVLTD